MTFGSGLPRTLGAVGVLLAGVGLATALPSPAQARGFVSFGIGFPLLPGPSYYYPPPPVVAYPPPAPVYYAPAPAYAPPPAAAYPAVRAVAGSRRLRLRAAAPGGVRIAIRQLRLCASTRLLLPAVLRLQPLLLSGTRLLPARLWLGRLLLLRRRWRSPPLPLNVDGPGTGISARRFPACHAKPSPVA